MTLLSLIKEGLRDEDKKIASAINFEISNDEVISDMITAELLNFHDSEHDQETR